MEDIKTNESNLKIVLIVLFTSIAASTVNPYGITQLILPFKFALQNDILKQNSEFRPMMQTDLKYIFIINCLVTLAALAVKGNRKISYYLLYAAFGYLAIKYHRNYALFILASYVPTVTGYQLLLNEYKKVRNNYLQKTLWLSVITIAACVMVLTVKNDGWGLGKVEGMFPEKSADFIQKNKPEGRIFNYYELGGYLGWRLYSDYSVSIDGRHYYYDTSYELHDKVFWHCDDWENILKKLDVNTVITPATSKIDAKIINLLYYLDASRDWILVNEEPSALLFIRKEQADKIKMIDKLDKDLIWVHVIQDAKTAMIRYDERNQSYFSLAIANFKLHGFPEALNYFKLYNRVNPQDEEVQHMISLLDASEAGDFKAQAELEKMFKNGRNL
jgi:hypothetical protein